MELQDCALPLLREVIPPESEDSESDEEADQDHPGFDLNGEEDEDALDSADADHN